MKIHAGGDGAKGIRPFYWLESAFWNLQSVTWDDKLLLAEYREHVEASVKWFREFSNPGGDRILDIGCGTGNYSLELAKNGFQVEGIDFSSRMLKKATIKAGRTNLKARFSKVDFNKTLPFPSHSFQYVISAATLQCVAEPFQFLNEVSRVLVPSGILMIVAISPLLRSAVPCDTSFARRLFWRIKPLFKAAKRIRRYNREEVVVMLKDANFEIIEEYRSKDGSIRILARSHE